MNIHYYLLALVYSRVISREQYWKTIRGWRARGLLKSTKAMGAYMGM